jgi:hypothetical protein
MSAVRKAFVVALALLAISAAADAQEVCDLDLGDLVAGAIQHRARMIGLANAPLASPASSETGAPAGAGGEDPVADASFPALIAVSLGVPTTASDTGAMTFDLTPFTVVATRDPSVIDKQSEYEKYENLRRVGVALTLGGQGEAFDRDGDGTVDDALSAEDWSDIVSVELRYRFFGTRDRRDRVNYQSYFQQIGDPFDAAATAFTDAAARISTAAAAVTPQADGRFCPADARALAEANPDKLDPSIEPIQRYLSVRADVLERIDGAPVWTAVIGTMERADEFGPDRWWLGIRGAGGLGPDQGWSTSLDYGKTDSLPGLEDASRLKLGLEWAALWGKRWIGGDGIRVSLSGAYEKWRDVPGSIDDNVASLNFKLAYPLTDTIKIPLSITWANKTQLLKDEAETRGYLGFTFDFDGALRKALL